MQTLNDLMRLLRTDRLVKEDKTREALALVEGPIMKIAGKRRKSLRRVMEFVAAEIGRGRAEQAREVVDDLLGGIFRHSAEGIVSWGEYRRRFERLFPEVIRYREPIAIKLYDHSTLVVQFFRKRVEAYRLELEHEDYDRARILFTIVHKDLDLSGQFDWSTERARTFTMLAHKSIRIELPFRGDCRVEFLGRPGVECRLDFDEARGQGAAFYIADRKGRLVRVFSDGGWQQSG